MQKFMDYNQHDSLNNEFVESKTFNQQPTQHKQLTGNRQLINNEQLQGNEQLESNEQLTSNEKVIQQGYNNQSMSNHREKGWLQKQLLLQQAMQQQGNEQPQSMKQEFLQKQQHQQHQQHQPQQKQLKQQYYEHQQHSVKQPCILQQQLLQSSTDEDFQGIKDSKVQGQGRSANLGNNSMGDLTRSISDPRASGISRSNADTASYDNIVSVAQDVNDNPNNYQNKLIMSNNQGLADNNKGLRNSNPRMTDCSTVDSSGYSYISDSYLSPSSTISPADQNLCSMVEDPSNIYTSIDDVMLDPLFSTQEMFASQQQIMTSQQQEMPTSQHGLPMGYAPQRTTRHQQNKMSQQQSMMTSQQQQSMTSQQQQLMSEQKFMTSQIQGNVAHQPGITSEQKLMTSQMNPQHYSMKFQQRGIVPYRQNISTALSVPNFSYNSLDIPIGNMDPMGLEPLSRKRKRPDSPTDSINQDSIGNDIRFFVPLKSEHYPPDLAYGMADEGVYFCGIGFDGSIKPECSSLGTSSASQIIFSSHSQSEWCQLVNECGQNMPGPAFKVTADKGFSFSHFDDSYVCQKKNHFQITTHTFFNQCPRYIRAPEGGLLPIRGFYLDFHGVKMDQQDNVIKVDQSHPDRSKHPYQPVQITLQSNVVSKVTVGRLHFSETTINNMRKKGKPNPDQKYFQLAVLLYAQTSYSSHLVLAQISDRIIVRASNPGQFEGDPDTLWSKGKPADSVYHLGNVGINTDNPDQALTVHGDIKCTGRVVAPSDERAKQSIEEIDTSEQLRNISRLKVYTYSYKDEFAKYAGLGNKGRTDTGVLAQEVAQIIPEAVEKTGNVTLPSGEVIDDFLVVNKDRIYIENVGAVKELCKVTNNLEYRVNEIEDLNRKWKENRKYPLKRSYSWRSSFSQDGSDFTDSSANKSASSSTVEALDLAQSNLPPYSLKPQNDYHRYHHHHYQKDHHHHHHHRRRNNVDNSSNNGPKSSKNIWDIKTDSEFEEKENGKRCFCLGSRALQIAVIVLVVVMAICLITLTVLLLVDNPNNSPYIPPLITLTTLIILEENKKTGPIYGTAAPNGTGNDTTPSYIPTTPSPDYGLVTLYIPELQRTYIPMSLACYNFTADCNITDVLNANIYIYNITLGDPETPNQLTMEFEEPASDSYFKLCESDYRNACEMNMSFVPDLPQSTALTVITQTSETSVWTVTIEFDVDALYIFQSSSSVECERLSTDGTRSYIVNIIWDCLDETTTPANNQFTNETVF